MTQSTTRVFRIGCSTAAALLLAVALASYDYRPAQAVGGFTVNSSLDNNTKDSVLTLREAILVANGTLTNSLSAGEKAQLGGCTFTGSADNWTISGGCGRGYTDTITFGFTTTVITLGVSLPALNDTYPTVLQGPASLLAEIVIDGSKLVTGTNALNIYSAGNSVEDLTFRNAPAAGAGIYVSGDDNRIWYGRAYGNHGPGIVLAGSAGTEVFGTELGLRSLDSPFACDASTRNGGPNVLLTGGTTGAVIDSITSVCAPGDGVLITGTTTMSNIVEYGYQGTWYHAGGLYYMGNAGAGIAVRGGSAANLIEHNTIGRNQYGIVIADSGSSHNVVHDNNIGRYLLAVIPNTRYGILIDGGAGDTQVLSNTVARNSQSGIVISSTTSNTALVQGNTINGQGANGIALIGSTGFNTLRDNNVYANGAHGILLTGTASYNSISGGAIHDNAGAGIAQGRSAGGNLWSHLSIYGNGGLGIDKRADGLPTGPYPVIQSYIRAAPGVIVTGVATPSLTVELYRVAPDPSGYGEGKQYVGEAVAAASGLWQIADPAGPGCYTAQMYGVLLFVPIASEFALNSPCVFLPMIAR